MKILVNKDIKHLFIAISMIMAVFFFLAEGSVWLLCREFSFVLLVLSLLTVGAVWAVCLRYFSRQNRIM